MALSQNFWLKTIVGKIDNPTAGSESTARAGRMNEIMVAEATAHAALDPFGYGSKGTTWDTSRTITAMSVITAEAAYDKNGALVTPEAKLSGFWIMIALPMEAAGLKALSALSQTRDRDAKSVANDKGAIGTYRLAPVFAGSQYTFGA